MAISKEKLLQALRPEHLKRYDSTWGYIHTPSLIELIEAIKENPNGLICGRCGQDNFYCDDIGWFNNEVENKGYVPVCSKCDERSASDR